MRRILLRKHTEHPVFLKGQHITSLCPWPTECGIYGMLNRVFYRLLHRIYRMLYKMCRVLYRIYRMLYMLCRVLCRMLCSMYRPMYRVFSGPEESRNQLPMSSQEAATQRGVSPTLTAWKQSGSTVWGAGVFGESPWNTCDFCPPVEGREPPPPRPRGCRDERWLAATPVQLAGRSAGSVTVLRLGGRPPEQGPGGPGPMLGVRSPWAMGSGGAGFCEEPRRPPPAERPQSALGSPPA